MKTQTKPLRIYLFFAFLLAWLCQAGACASLLYGGNTSLYSALLSVCMFAPLAAVLLTQKVFGHGETGIGWKPSIRGNIGWYLAAWFGPVVLTVLGGAVYFLVFPAQFDPACTGLAAAAGPQLEAAGMSAQTYLLISLAQAVVLAPFLNMIPALGEEAGWRFFLYPRLKARFGSTKGRILGGVIWGVWHWPLILLVGYEYGTQYFGAPVAGPLMFCVVCVFLGTLLDVLGEKTGSVWAPALFHGAFNAVAALPMYVAVPETANRFAILGPMCIGLIGILPMAAIAIFALVKTGGKASVQ